MKISDVIKELQERMDIYGDSEVIFRDCDGDEDIYILSVYYDDEAERAIVSNFVDVFAE